MAKAKRKEFTIADLEKLHTSGLWWLFLASLISSDTLMTVEECDTSLEILLELKQVLPKTNIPESDWKKFVNDGIEICERDKEMFLKNGNERQEVEHIS